MKPAGQRLIFILVFAFCLHLVWMFLRAWSVGKSSGHCFEEVELGPNTPLRRTFFQTVGGEESSQASWFGDFMLSQNFTECSRLSSECSLLLLYREKYSHQEILKCAMDHQIVNRIPGFENVTTKVNLATYPGLSAIPKSFQMPQDLEEFQQYRSANPEARFLTKHTSFHSIKLVQHNQPLDDLDEKFFVQQFVDDLLLADGHLFEFDLFLLVTSVSPLRVYISMDRLGLKFCSEPYHPFDPENRDKYVVSNTWADHPRLVKGKKRGMKMQEILEQLIQDSGGNIPAFWNRVDETIADIFLQVSMDLEERGVLKDHQKKAGFFELVRVDFLLDTRFQVHILEFARIAWPNYRLRRIYSSIFSMLGLTSEGVGSYDSSEVSTSVDEAMRCLQCIDCQTIRCAMCPRCLRDTDHRGFNEANREGMVTETVFRRIFPRPVTPAWNDTDRKSMQRQFDKMGRANWVLQQWFVRKCLADHRWCN